MALILPGEIRDDPESPFLRLFRNNAREFRERFTFICTDGTAKALDRTGFYRLSDDLEPLAPGSQGGIIEIANEVVLGRCHAVVFLYDPESLHSESPETRALVRECIQKEIPLLNTVETAAFWLKHDYQASSLPQPTDPLKQLPFQHIGSIREADDLAHCTIALIAHDRKKADMLRYVEHYYADFLSRFGRILTTESTGIQIVGTLHRKDIPMARHFHLVDSGPKGGDIRIATEVIHGRCQCVVFFQDSLSSHPHEADISLLRRACQARTAACVLLSDEQSARQWTEARKVGGTLNPAFSVAGSFRRRHGLSEVLIADLPEMRALSDKYDKLLANHNLEGWFDQGESRRAHDQIVADGAQQLAVLAAHYVEDQLKKFSIDRRKIAVMHGQTISRFVGVMKGREARVPGVRVVAGCKAIGLSKHDAPLLAKELAVVLWDDEQRSGHASAPESNEVRDILPSMLVAAIMPIPSERGPLQYLRPYTDGTGPLKHTIECAVEDGAVGLVGGIFLGSDGGVVDGAWQADKQEEVQDGLHVLSYPDCRTMVKNGARNVLLVGLDKRRDRAVAAAIRARLINVLVTDLATLQRVDMLLTAPTPVEREGAKI